MGKWYEFFNKETKTNKEQINDYVNLKGSTESILETLETVIQGVRRDNNVYKSGEVVYQPVFTDASKAYKNMEINNVLPQYLNQLYKQVPLHSAILNYKRDYLSKNYSFLYKSSVDNDIKLNKFKNNIIQKRSDFDDFDDFLKGIILDYLAQGNLYLKITTKNFEIVKIEHLQGERVRVLSDIDPRSLEIKGYAYNVDWLNSSNYIRYPKYDAGISNQTSVLCYKNIKPDYKFYGEPDYISALNWLELNANIGNFHKKNIINGLYPSIFMTLYEFPRETEALNNFKRRLSKMGGTGDAGKIFVSFGSNKELAPDIQKLNTNNLDKEFLRVAEDVQREICFAHKIDPAVMGIKTPGSLGNSNEIEYQTIQFNKNMLNLKKDIDKIINKLLKLCKMDIKFEYEKY